MIKLNKLKNRLKTVGFMMGVAVVLTACATSYRGSDVKYGDGVTDYYRLGSGFRAWDRIYYGYGGPGPQPQYYNRVNWVGYYDVTGRFHPSYYYYYLGAR